MNTNINNQFITTLKAIAGTLLAIPLIAATSWPQPALAFTERVQPARGVVFLVETKIPIVLVKGSILGVTASAYSSTVSQTDADPFTTASGARVRSGIIAANFLPLGTVVEIDSQQYVVDDRLNVRYNNVPQVDIWMPTTTQAFSYGIRTTALKIISLPQD